ncbi:glycosyltransferase family 4 protein [Terasakiella sp. A23]|uniref:glycosyltransferase family 4 protein n=1 Tax=Terasakiella sp. FCG-A23 TaxID=3080561 RepID=UPI0029540E99|nr:glycosyltransferase family 4 protein [Terasakiella sp. A23]MDV7340825.1 glycosyltransferase family 4 protein [Terasakiella sp. A23]
MEKQKLKICLLAAANSSHTYLQSGILQSFGHEVTLVSPDAGRVPDGVRHVPCAVENTSGIMGKLKWLYQIYKGVRSVKADVYHAHYAAELTTWMAALVGKRPLVISCLGGDVLFEEQGSQGPIGEWLTKWSLKKCDHITVVSNFLGDAVEGFGISRSKIQRVVWGVNHTIFGPKDGQKNYRDLWQVADDAQIIFSPRMLKPFYNQAMMVDALKRVVKVCPKAVLVFSTYNQDEGFRKELEAQISAEGLSENVRFAPPMNQQEMVIAYNTADLVLSLSPSDGTPVSIMEAMACGTPVVMTDLDRYQEFFTHAETGYFTPLDAEKASEGIIALLQGRTLYERLQSQAMAVVKEKADLHSQSRLLEECSYRLLDRT